MSQAELDWSPDLSDIDLDAAPPCSIIKVPEMVLCPNPAVTRFRRECLDCGKVSFNFACEEHKKIILGSGRFVIGCGKCLSPRATWKEI